MSRNQDTEVRNTISNKDWNKLRNRARKANPHVYDLSDPRGVKCRQQSAEQLKKARWS